MEDIGLDARGALVAIIRYDVERDRGYWSTKSIVGSSAGFNYTTNCDRRCSFGSEREQV